MASRRLLVIAALVCGGCRQVLGLDDLPDSIPACSGTTFGDGIVQVCVDVLEAPLQLTGALDTDTSDLCIGELRDGTPACVVAGDGVTIATLRASGARPLVIVSPNMISLMPAGLLDVGSHRSTEHIRGAGADPAACGTPIEATFATDGGGGYGGTFGRVGGDGGAGILGGMAGTASEPEPSPTTLRGGCPGGRGAAMVNSAAVEETRGRGGGAVYLIAGSEIQIEGPINASGSPGLGGIPDGLGAGGGGGGSGGLIGLEAPIITISADTPIMANGGGGGEGASMVAGGNGAEPDIDAPQVAAAGGTGSGSGGDGGAGSSGAERGGDGGAGAGGNPAGGGGGGGGAGVVIVRGTRSGGSFSPPPREN